MAEYEFNERSKEDIVILVEIILLFSAVLAGRELGSLYNEYVETSRLSVFLEVAEEDFALFIKKASNGSDLNLNTGLVFSIPSFESVEREKTEIPDYVRRWLISLTLNAITVRQPEASDMEVELWVEDSLIKKSIFKFEREKISFFSLLNRTLFFKLEDREKFLNSVDEASRKYGGEVKVTLKGRVLSHIYFFSFWLPFSTTRYPLTKPPHAELISSSWSNLNGTRISKANKGENLYISMSLKNPTRIHSMWENVTAKIYLSSIDEPIAYISKTVGIAAGSRVIYILPFTPTESGTYHYSLETIGGFKLEVKDSPILEVG
ncbi:hypothetical protein KEJ47_04175 [Candidatus Bathyarchaeota archaeon]|nr:hypothetical protein [Candidatus Bathyarchaeota archaeon]